MNDLQIVNEDAQNSGPKDLNLAEELVEGVNHLLESSTSVKPVEDIPLEQEQPFDCTFPSCRMK